MPATRLLDDPMSTMRAAVSTHRVELLAALGLMCLYLAVMNGHFLSIDGLLMWRQALSIVRHHSFSFVPPIWWGSTITTSNRGIGASLQYIPSLVMFSWLAPYTPSPGQSYDFGLLYSDRLYAIAGAPIWVLITAATALVVGLTTRALGVRRPAALWAMAFYGLGSPALAASRGDFPQPLVAACWIVGIYACLRLSDTGGRRWLWVCSASIFVAVLARPLEGSLLVPAVLLLLTRDLRSHLPRIMVLGGAWAGAVVVTLAVNWARFGSPFDFGYGSLSWTTPIWVGFPYALLSPGRGELWAFPGMVLAVLGAVFLWRRGRRLVALVLAGLPSVLFVESCTFYAWIPGWDWGFRLFQPALPLVAVLAGIGATQLPRKLKGWLPSLLLVGGLVWNIPAVTTDLLGGYASTYDNIGSWYKLEAYPPIGAWRFLRHIRPQGGADASALDIIWFRTAGITHWASLVPFLLLLGASASLWASAIRTELGRPLLRNRDGG
jgi:hypothetical protein